MRARVHCANVHMYSLDIPRFLRSESMLFISKQPLSKKKAFDICLKVAKEYVEGNVKVEDMKARKDALVNELAV